MARYPQAGKVMVVRHDGKNAKKNVDANGGRSVE